jgi:hypothetical protein
MAAAAASWCTPSLVLSHLGTVGPSARGNEKRRERGAAGRARLSELSEQREARLKEDTPPLSVNTVSATQHNTTQEGRSRAVSLCLCLCVSKQRELSVLKNWNFDHVLSTMSFGRASAGWRGLA